MINVPYDENLLERARTQWQFGDWESLAKLDRETIQHHPDRAKLALLAASGRLQVGDVSEAGELIGQAQDWGVSKKNLAQILIAGVHNSLGRADALAGQHRSALQHFKNAISIGVPGADRRLVTQARINEQYSQIGLPQPAITASTPTLVSIKRPYFRVETLAKFNLGDAWAGNTINTVIFRHHGILTDKNTQYTAFYVDNHTLRMVRRNLEDDAIETHDIHDEYNLQDAHNSINLGIDRQGYLHICYDHHASRLRYKRSLHPGDIASWSEELSMTGLHEDKVTYPTFILPHQEFPLTLLYRDGVHDKGTARIKTYDEVVQSWSDHPQAILSGS